MNLRNNPLIAHQQAKKKTPTYLFLLDVINVYEALEQHVFNLSVFLQIVTKAVQSLMDPPQPTHICPLRTAGDNAALVLVLFFINSKVLFQAKYIFYIINNEDYRIIKK